MRDPHLELLVQVCRPVPSAHARSERILRCRAARRDLPVNARSVARVLGLSLVESALRAPLRRLGPNRLPGLFLHLVDHLAFSEASLVALAAQAPELALALRQALEARHPNRHTRRLLEDARRAWPDRVPATLEAPSPNPSSWPKYRQRIREHPENVSAATLLRHVVEAGLSTDDLDGLHGDAVALARLATAGRIDALAERATPEVLAVWARCTAAARRAVPTSVRRRLPAGLDREGLDAITEPSARAAWADEAALLPRDRRRQALSWYARTTGSLDGLLDANALTVEDRTWLALERVHAERSPQGVRRAFRDLLRAAAEPVEGWRKGREALDRTTSAWSDWLQRHRSRRSHREASPPRSLEALHTASDPVWLVDALFDHLWADLSARERPRAFVRLLDRLAPGDPAPLFHATRRWLDAEARPGHREAVERALVFVEMLVYGLRGQRPSFLEQARSLGKDDPSLAAGLLKQLPDEPDFLRLRFVFAAASGRGRGQLPSLGDAVGCPHLARAVARYLRGERQAAAPRWRDAAPETGERWAEHVWVVLGLLLAHHGEVRAAWLDDLAPAGHAARRLADAWSEAATGHASATDHWRRVVDGDSGALVEVIGPHPGRLERELLEAAAAGGRFLVSTAWRDLGAADAERLLELIEETAASRDVDWANAIAERALELGDEEVLGVVADTVALAPTPRLRVLVACRRTGPELAHAVMHADPEGIEAHQDALLDLATQARGDATLAALAERHPLFWLRIHARVPSTRAERMELRARLRAAIHELASTESSDARLERAAAAFPVRWTSAAQAQWRALERDAPDAARPARRQLGVIVDHEADRSGRGTRCRYLRTKVGTSLCGIGAGHDPYRMVVALRDGGLDLLWVGAVTDHDAYERLLTREAEARLLAEPVGPVSPDVLGG